MALNLRCSARLVQLPLGNGTSMIGCDGVHEKCPKEKGKGDLNEDCFL